MNRLRLLAWVLPVALASGCLFGGESEAVQAAVALGFQRGSVVDLDGEALGVRSTQGGVEAVYVYPGEDGEWLSTEVGSADLIAGTNMRGMSSGSGLGLGWNTFIFGTAEDGVTSVQSNLPGARGGAVVGGTWVIASPDEGVQIGDVMLNFLDSEGNIVESL